MKKLLMLGLFFAVTLLIAGCEPKTPPKEDPIVTYTVTFDVDGVLTTITVNEGQLVQAPLTPSKIGHSFTGWYSEDARYEFSTPITSNTIIEARFSPNPQTVLFLNENGTAITTLQVGYGLAIDDFPEVTKPGHTFVHWEHNGTIFLTDTPVFGQTILKAVFEINTYRVTYVNDELESIGYEDVTYGDTLEMPTAPTKQGYVFMGWLLEDELFDFAIPITQAITLKARFVVEGEGLPHDVVLYYEGYEDHTGNALFMFLRQRINTGVTMQTYGDARTILWEADRDPNNVNNLILIYRRTSVPGVWDEGITWNREHVWPQSLLGVDTKNSNRHVGADLHNLKPANPRENSSRGNKFFDEVTNGQSYAPPLEVRGDIARMMFYMITMYDYLSLVEGNPSTYQMSKYSVLLRWHTEDPVDDFERDRNNVIYAYQRNRNPYIDYPHFVERIFVSQPLIHYSRPLTHFHFQIEV